MQEYKMYIGGKWVDAVSGKTLTTINPATEEPVAVVPCAARADVDAAVSEAKKAFSIWSKVPQAERTRVCGLIAQKIRANAQNLAMQECIEHGTPIKDALGIVMGAASKFDYSGAIARSVMGTQIPVDEETVSYLQREPAGVVGLIIPWNLPTIMLAVKIAPVIAIGCTCVIKPPSINSSIGLNFMKVFENVGLPDGVVNMVTGPGATVGNAIAEHPDIDMLGFTGSSETGKALMSAASGTVKKCVMELGGNNPAIIMDDANVDDALRVLGFRQFNNCGQHCSGPGRYYVHEKKYDEFLEKFVSFTESVKVGDPRSEDTFMGAIVSKEHYDKVVGYIGSGVAEGAKLLKGGVRPEAAGERGFWLEPTIICDAKHDMKIAREEIFGPVAVVIKYSDSDDLLSLANDSPYGLCAHVWCGDIRRGMKTVNDLRCGAVFVNCQMLTDDQPWGTNIKQSGIGKEGGIDGMLEFTVQKLVCIRY